MSDVDAVIGLLERWRDAGAMDRMRIAMEATSTIGRLPAGRKRALAIEVAERVAPKLVPAIRAEDGDLSSEQVAALIDLLRRADREQLDSLIAALRTGDVVGAVDLVDDAVDAVAPPDPEMDALLADLLEEDEVVAIEETAEEEPVADDHEVEVAEDRSLELDEAAVRARMEEEAAERAAQYRDTSRDTPRAPVYRAPALDFISDIDLPDPTVEEVEPLAAASGGGRDGASEPRGVLGTGPTPAVVAAITATPDGYRRRRAALAAIREGRLDGDDLPAVVRSMERGTDRSWVAGAALDAGLVALGDLDGLGLSAAAQDRLRRRAS